MKKDRRSTVTHENNEEWPNLYEDQLVSYKCYDKVKETTGAHYSDLN